MEKKLFRNEHEKVIAGVSSGIAQYMEVDVTIIRLLFVLSTIFLVGTGILVYIIMWIIVPVNNDPAARFSKFNDFFKEQQHDPFQSSNSFQQPKGTSGNTGPFQNWSSSTVKEDDFSGWKKPGDFKPYKRNNDTGRTVGGLFLLAIGLYFLMDEFHMIPFGFSLSKLWPLVFIAIGASFIIKSKSHNEWETWKRQNYQDPKNNSTDPVSPVDPLNPEKPNDSADDSAQTDDRFTKKDI